MELRQMHNPRTIKKYPNRRLYDSVESRYITLADLKTLVLEQIEFTVVERNSQQDITNAVLLQVLAEGERSETPLFNRNLLLQLIRSSGSSMRGSIGGHLAQSLAVLLAAANSNTRPPKLDDGSFSGEKTDRDAAQLNFERWRTLQEEMYRALTDRTREHSGPE